MIQSYNTSHIDKYYLRIKTLFAAGADGYGCGSIHTLKDLNKAHGDIGNHGRFI